MGDRGVERTEMSRALIVMAKRPHAGSTKTRLTPGFTPEQAAALYSAMLADIVAVLGSRTDAELMIAADKPDSVAWFEETFPGVPIVLQRGATLGERLDGVLGEAPVSYTHLTLPTICSV